MEPTPVATVMREVLPESVRGIEAVPPDVMRESAEDRAEREALAHEHRRNRYLRRLPRRYADATFADLHPVEQDPSGKVSGWLDTDAPTLLLSSAEPGLGKTHAAYAVGSHAIERGLTVEAYYVPDLLADLRPNLRDPLMPEETREDVTTCDLLILDDLGKESLGSGWVREQINLVLDARLRENLRTVITTNLSAEEMGQRYDYTLLDRVIDAAVIVKVTGKSRRKPMEF